MSLWDGLGTDAEKRITIIGATNRYVATLIHTDELSSPWTVDEAILRRMPLTFKIQLPDAAQRQSILQVVIIFNLKFST